MYAHNYVGNCIKRPCGLMALWPCANERASGDCKRQPCGFTLMSEHRNCETELIWNWSMSC